MVIQAFASTAILGSLTSTLCNLKGRMMSSDCSFCGQVERDKSATQTLQLKCLILTENLQLFQPQPGSWRAEVGKSQIESFPQISNHLGK